MRMKASFVPVSHPKWRNGRPVLLAHAMMRWMLWPGVCSRSPCASRVPARQPARHPLPLDITRERFTTQFDPDKDGVITRRELGRRTDLLAIWDDNGDGLLTPNEWQQQVDLVGGLGVRVTVEGFLERWDLDGDGQVTPQELKLPVAVLIRLGLRKP